MRDHETQRTGTATVEAAEGRLVPLSELLHNHRIASGDPDVRGWEVVGSDGRKLGRVHDLLVDTGSQRVRYLDVELDRELHSGSLPREGGRDPLGPEGQPMAGAETVGLADTGVKEGPGIARTEDRHVLIPVGMGRLTPGDDRVHLAALRADQAFSLPAWRHGELTPELEADLRQRSGQSWLSGKAPGDFDLYDEDRFYGERRGGR